MNLILDVTAAILLASAIKSAVLHWFHVEEEDRRGGEKNAVALWTGYIAIAIAGVFVAWRLFRQM
jgi:hypothetical protein